MSPPAPDRPPPPALAPLVAALAVGLLLVVAYHLLARFEVARTGAPTDIGGGAVLLAGYVLVLVGGGGLVVALWQRRRDP